MIHGSAIVVARSQITLAVAAALSRVRYGIGMGTARVLGAGDAPLSGCKAPGPLASQGAAPDGVAPTPGRPGRGPGAPGLRGETALPRPSPRRQGPAPAIPPHVELQREARACAPPFQPQLGAVSCSPPPAAAPAVPPHSGHYLGPRTPHVVLRGTL